MPPATGTPLRMSRCTPVPLDAPRDQPRRAHREVRAVEGHTRDVDVARDGDREVVDGRAVTSSYSESAW
jgi:hypothetical protein